MSHFLQLLATIALVPGALGATLIASHFSGGVYTLSLTGTNTSGTLSIASQTNGCGNMPAWIQYYGDTRKLYCFDESGSGNGVLAEYSVANDGRLSRTGQGKTLGNTVYGRLYGGTDGKGFVATAEYTPSTISTYKLPLSGNSALAVTKFTLAQHGPNTRQDAPHPHEVQLDPTGKFILNPDLGADIVRIFKIDASSGRLTLCGQGQAGAGDGPRHIEFWKSASGAQKAFTVNELGNSVTAWDVAYPSGDSGCLSLKRTQTLSTYAPGKKGGPTTKAAELRLVGNFLYATNRADETFGTQQDSIAIYTIDPTTGAITWLEAANSYSYYPRTFQFNQDGSLLAVGGQTSSNVAIIPRDPATGKLGKLLATIQIAQKGTAGGEDGLSAVVWAE